MRTHLFGQITAINCCTVVLKSLTDSLLTNCNLAWEFLKSTTAKLPFTCDFNRLVLQVQTCSFNSNVLNVSQACVYPEERWQIGRCTILISCNKGNDISLAPSTHLFNITYILIWKYQQSQHTSVEIPRLDGIRGNALMSYCEDNDHRCTEHMHIPADVV